MLSCALKFEMATAWLSSSPVYPARPTFSTPQTGSRKGYVSKNSSQVYCQIVKKNSIHFYIRNLTVKIINNDVTSQGIHFSEHLFK